MTFEKGWINRQCTRVERDVQSWPAWMQREVDVRASERLESQESRGCGQQRSEERGECGAVEPRTMEAGS